MSKKLSRRDFGRTAAAAVALPAALIGNDVPTANESAAAKGAAVARRRRMSMPMEVTYGGVSADGRDVLLQDTLTPPGQSAKSYPGGWQEGTTIPAEYYMEEKHYFNDERVIAEYFWLMADHETRIPKAGDYFVFEYGRGDSVVVLRDQAGAVKAYHNVCRHRGSRLCMHGTEFDNVRPSEAKPDGKPVNPRLSVRQLGSSGNTPVFRCPYHGWTYDLSGKLVSFPPGMPSGFDPAEHGLRPAHVRTVEGFIYLSFAQQDPPDFDSFVANWRRECQVYGTANLKVAARRQYPTKANWKLVVENFRECYHCPQAHKSLVTVQYWQDIMSPERRARYEQEFSRHGHAVARTRDGYGSQGQDALVPRQRDGGMDVGGIKQHLSPGFVTGSLDGKPVAPLLLKEWTHRRGGATTGFSTSFFAAYDDHVAVARFTPRDVMMTDVEIFWLVKGDAKEKDVDVDRLMALWDTTYREDRWVVENNQHGIKSGRYHGGQPYSGTEGGPAGFIKWYMTEVAPRVSGQHVSAG